MTGPSQRLEQRQSQKLIMTQRVQQAIKMLQKSNLELTDIIDTEAPPEPAAGMARTKPRTKCAGE